MAGRTALPNVPGLGIAPPPHDADDAEAAGGGEGEENEAQGGGGAPDAGALVLPLPSTPGTLVYEFLQQTAGRGGAEIAQSFQRVYALFEGDVSPAEMLQQVLGEEETSCFLTVLPTSPEVVLIHSLGRFNVSFGATNMFHGKVFGLVGETLEGQLPPIVQQPLGSAEEVADALFQVNSFPLVTQESLEQHYAAATASLLARHAGNAPEEEGDDQIKTCALAYIPNDWAPYFLTPLPPFQALRTIERLRERLPEGNRDACEPLLAWARLACTRKARQGAGASQSRLSIPWQAVTPDLKLMRWAKKSFAKAVQATAPDPVPTLDAQECFNKACETVRAIRADGAGGARKDYTLGEKSFLKAFTAQEDEENWPSLYGEVREEGRTKAGVGRVLIKKLLPGKDDSDPIRIYVSAEMTKDVKELNYAHDGEVTFEDCHRGVSPFAVPHTSLAQQRSRKRDLDSLEEATSTTAEEIKKSREVTVSCPTDYYSFLRQLANYDKFLMELAGEENFHRKEVVEIRRVLRERVAIFENISPENILQILWAILDDARQLCKKCLEWQEGQPFPRSDLKYVVNFLRTGRILPLEHCPVEDFLGSSVSRRKAASAAYVGKSQEVDEEFPEADAPLKNNEVHPAIREVIGDLKREYPAVTVTALMAAPPQPLSYVDLRMGKPGTCLTYNILGECTTKCNYRHNAARPKEPRAKEIAEKLTPAVEAYRGKMARKRPRK